MNCKKVQVQLGLGESEQRKKNLNSNQVHKCPSIQVL